MPHIFTKLKQRFFSHFDKQKAKVTKTEEIPVEDNVRMTNNPSFDADEKPLHGVAVNIVELIENNPITKLSASYNNRLKIKIKETFTDTQQQLFVSSFYCYLNYNQKNDFVINLDDIWEWVGFSQKDNAKKVIEKNFDIGIDYKISLCDKTKGRGGSNKEIIMLTLKTFKLFCFKVGTKKADQIHEYLLLLEETLYDIMEEESKDIKFQLENHVVNSERDKEFVRERTILEQFGVNTQAIYLGIIDNINSANEPLIKFGCSNELRKRVKQHKITFDNFRLAHAYKVENKTMVENMIKSHPLLVGLRRTISINNVNQTELLAIDVEKLDKIVKEIILMVEFSPDNYKLLLEKNQALQDELAKFKNRKNDTTAIAKSATAKYVRGKDKLYHIDGGTYKKLTGTREEVWSEVAYKTSGSLTKTDFHIGEDDKIVQNHIKKKFHNYNK